MATPRRWAKLRQREKVMDWPSLTDSKTETLKSWAMLRPMEITMARQTR